MVAMSQYDKGLSILSNSQFHQGAPIESVSIESARSIMDFDIIKEQSHRPNGDAIDGQFHLVRPDHDIVIGKGVGSDFTTDNNVKTFNWIVDNIMPHFPNMKIVTAATCHSGATAFVDFSMGDSYSLPNDSSEHFSNLLFNNAVTQAALCLGGHSVRVVCMNTLAMATKATQFKVSHTKNMMNTVYCDLEIIKKEMLRIDELRNKSTILAEKLVKSEDVTKIMDMVFPLVDKEGKSLSYIKNRRDEAMARFEDTKGQGFTNDTFWSLYNAIGYGNSHANITANRDGAAIELNQMIGLNAKKNADIFNTIYDYALAA